MEHARPPLELSLELGPAKRRSCDKCGGSWCDSGYKCPAKTARYNRRASVCPVRKIPIGVRDKLQVELKRMEDMDVIRKVSNPTEWVNAIVGEAKKNGTIRVCLDPRPLNRAVRRAHYPLPTLTEIAA
ncbi:uncharacterized protein LOC126965189 [Leptidea sinapis]|uniref:uncharacterized protein LOC126965189 n=1 Tax=Leptidea sinapis TaxID=189913 RepID=UPI0021C43803|nr:uncharacterized protein LOC126965189 [Leptidea sinapis]